MSRKTIQFQTPKKSVDEASTSASENISVPEGTSVDQWVHQQQAASEIALADEMQEGTDSSLTITISAAPNWFDAVKMGFLLPYLTVWVWTLGAAQKNLRLFSR
jgi:hypothetical protein